MAAPLLKYGSISQYKFHPHVNDELNSVLLNPSLCHELSQCVAILASILTADGIASQRALRERFMSAKNKRSEVTRLSMQRINIATMYTAMPI